MHYCFVTQVTITQTGCIHSLEIGAQHQVWCWFVGRQIWWTGLWELLTGDNFSWRLGIFGREHYWERSPAQALQRLLHICSYELSDTSGARSQGMLRQRDAGEGIFQTAPRSSELSWFLEHSLWPEVSVSRWEDLLRGRNLSSGVNLSMCTTEDNSCKVGWDQVQSAPLAGSWPDPG